MNRFGRFTKPLLRVVLFVGLLVGITLWSRHSPDTVVMVCRPVGYVCLGLICLAGLAISCLLVCMLIACSGSKPEPRVSVSLTKQR